MNMTVNNRLYYNKKYLFLLMMAVGFVFNACKKEDDPVPVDPVAPVSANAEVNNWIYETMNEYYYWNSTLPSDPEKEQEPDAFFQDLLNRPDDRFSVLVPDYDVLINSLGGVNKEAGYEFDLYLEEEGSDNVIAIVLYAKRGSPAEATGLKRGDVIYQINGKQINLGNYQDLLGDISESHTLKFRRFNEVLDVYEDQDMVSLNPVELAENPHYLDTVYTATNGDKVGYYVYNFFARGASNDGSQYDDEMDAIFAEFKADGIKHLILDLRYNGGGLVSSAVNMASLIGSNINENEVFFRQEFNPELQDVIVEEEGEDYLLEKFKNKPQNIGAQLTGGNFIVLVTDRTASASELVINGLLPYMDVTIMGDTTYGKNVGSFPIQDIQNKEKNKYGLLPIVFKSFNSRGQSEYSKGFAPDVRIVETSEILRPLGDVNEVMLKTALTEISGEGARINRLPEPSIYARSLGGTLDLKQRQGLLLDDQFPQEILLRPTPQ